MLKKTKPVILFLTLILFVESTFSQQQFPEYLKQKFLEYTKSVPREEIFAHTDRNEFIAGENLWFKLYLIDRQSSMPSPNSRIAYFELLNSENRPVVQKRILLTNGTGPGQVALPDTLSSGIYTIRVYTNWMKNFLPDNCFLKDINIYNALKKKRIAKRNYSDFNFGNSVGIPDRDGSPVNSSLLKINNSRPDSLELIINSDIKFRNENKNRIYLFIHTNGLISRISTEIVSNDLTRISISKNKLIPGINHISVFDQEGRPLCERFIYLPSAHGRLFNVSCTADCNLRNKISIQIDFPQESSQSVNPADLSISVAPVTENTDTIDLDEYMMIGTEFGFTAMSKYKNRRVADLSPESIDSLLLNVSSSWINWSGILKDSRPVPDYPAEKDDYFLSGKLLSGENKSSDSSEYVFMCTPGKQPGFQYSETGNEGKFSFRINIDEELKDLIIIPDKVSGNKKIIIEPSFSDRYPPQQISSDSSGLPEPSYIPLWSANYQVNKIYKTSGTGKKPDPVTAPLKPVRFYGKPDLELLLADYISLPTMEEVFFELIPRVYLKRKKSSYEIYISDRVDDTQNLLFPSLLIDGVIIKDASLIAGLNPETVKEIDVIKDKYIVGSYSFPGIVNVITKSANFSSFPLPDYMVRLSYRVVEPVVSFASPDYQNSEKRNSRIPDFRNTLYWNPSVAQEKNGKAAIEFWSSDIPSDYLITIHGITPGGKKISLRKYIKVNPD